MNEFVNFKKRGITLPPGCKDLIDLLQRSSRSVIDGPSRLTATRNDTVTGRLPDVGKYVRIAFESGEAIFTLGITEPGGRLEFALLRVKGDEPRASIAFPNEREEERVVREFFTRRGLQIPESSDTAPGFFLTDLPYQLVYRISSLPFDVAGVSALVTDILRECGRLTDDMPLSFHIEEAFDAA
ncbi:MAG TPA: hypothetical protein VFE51_15395 [Verrucomicrobiae bacterium]|nr:hypothetical protein [Verrucomicrobiae bacterium]